MIENIKLVGNAITWLLIISVLMSIIDFINSGRVDVTEITNVYGTKTTQIRW